MGRMHRRMRGTPSGNDARFAKKCQGDFLNLRWPCLSVLLFSACRCHFWSNRQGIGTKRSGADKKRRREAFHWRFALSLLLVVLGPLGFKRFFFALYMPLKNADLRNLLYSYKSLRKTEDLAVDLSRKV